MHAKLSIVALLSTLLLPASSFGQVFDYGSQSEATRELNRFRAAGRVENYTNVADRDRTINNGFGATRLVDPGASSVPTSIQPPRARSASFGVGTASSANSKPFANFNPSPTVSPYLNLFRDSIDGSDDLNYQTLVRPQLQQERFNSQVRRQEMQVNQELTAISARNAYNVTGNERVAPTGHSATFQNFSRFYPAKSQQRRRR